MSRRTTSWPAGMPCWIDLRAPDIAAAQAFYTAVLGWSYPETDGAYDGYALAMVDGAAAAGIGPLHSGETPSWTLYLASDDVQKTADAVREFGGTVIVPPVEVGELGRFCMAADPTGAMFGVWEAGTHIGAGVVNEPGAFTWDDLRTTDPGVARQFYTDVFGYRVEAMPPMPEMPDMDYALFFPPEEQAPLGGMGEMMGAQGPSHWLIYVGVPDTSAAVTAVEQAGGSVVQPATQTPYGAIAVLADPAGAVFAVVQTDGQGQPDRSG